MNVIKKRSESTNKNKGYFKQNILDYHLNINQKQDMIREFRMLFLKK